MGQSYYYFSHEFLKSLLYMMPIRSVSGRPNVCCGCYNSQANRRRTALETMVKNLAKEKMLDLTQQKKYLSWLEQENKIQLNVQRKTPIFLTTECTLLPVNFIDPDHSDHATLGYVVLEQIQEIFCIPKADCAGIIFKDGQMLETVQKYRSVHSHFQHILQAKEVYYTLQTGGMLDAGSAAHTGLSERTDSHSSDVLV